MSVGAVAGDDSGRHQMEIDKSQIVDLLRVRGQHDKAEKAERELTGPVDTSDHELLARYDLDEEAVIGGLEDTKGLGENLDFPPP